MNKYNAISLVILAALFLLTSLSKAEVIIPPSPGNLLTVTVEPNVTKDPNTQMYTYSYSVTNNTGSHQDMWFLAVEISDDAEIFDSTAPQGWRFSKNLMENMVSWGAIEIGPLPADFVDDGSVVPSAYNLKPGQTLNGFSFQTLNAPDTAKFYAQGFTKTPVVTSESDIDIFDVQVPHFTKDSFSSDTTSATQPTYQGGRRPAVDGFLVFLNLHKRDNKLSSPIYVATKFSVAGEFVYRNTFKATLNGVDVTHLFMDDTTFDGDLLAMFDVNNTPLKVGRNVLITSVDGKVPGTSRVATDVDRLTIIVE